MLARRFVALAWVSLVPQSVAAQTHVAPETPLSVEQTRATVEAVARVIDSIYVFPEQRAVISSKLRAELAAGRYASLDATALAARITDDLKAVSNDRHLWMRWSPPEYAAASMPASDSGMARDAYYAAVGRRRNQGIEELRILPGNIRYVRYTNFLWEPDVTGRAIDDAMRFLRDGDAMIVDLRGNGGGSAGAVQYAISHFLKGDLPLMSFYDGRTGERTETRTIEYLPTGRLPAKALYVLTDGGTGSAAEEFAYHVQQFKLGTLIGQKTAGAANNNELYPVTPGFILSVSFGRPTHPISKTNWEGTGISPDVAIPPGQALDKAQALALDRLASTATDDEAKARYLWAKDAVDARLHPVTLSAAELGKYVGRYGERTVRLEKGELIYSRPGRGDTRLTVLTPDLFAFGELSFIRVRFIRGGNRVVALEALYDDGRHERYDRDR